MIFIIKNFVFAYFKFNIRCHLIANQRAYFFVILKNVRKKVKELKMKNGAFLKMAESSVLFLRRREVCSFFKKRSEKYAHFKQIEQKVPRVESTVVVRFFLMKRSGKYSPF